MAGLNPCKSRRTQLTAAFLGAAVLITAPMASAQRPAARPVYRSYQRPVISQLPARPAVSRPMPVRPMMYAQPMPVPRVPVRSMPRPLPARTYVLPTAHTPYSFAQPAMPPVNFQPAFQPAFQPKVAWRGAGPGEYFNWFLFGGALVPDYGFWQVPSNYQMLPLGFGLWPACDSAAMPGRFWTIGPCFGAGDYQLAPAYENEYATGNMAPEYYQEPLFIVEQPEAPPAAKQSSAPEVKPNMVICLTDGRQLEVSDWWVTEGRFFFIPVNGKTESVDLDALNLKKTIETDEQRGRTFMLNFTPPDQRPVLPALPSQ